MSDQYSVLAVLVISDFNMNMILTILTMV